MNRDAFFDSVRASLFNGRLKQSQVDGLNFILDQWNETGFINRQWLAYALATAFHETALTMQPIHEYGRGRGKKYGRKDPETGKAYYGRGYVQLTWKSNYETASRALGTNLVRHPDLAMEPENAACIMFRGMKDGWFTGKSFEDYLNEQLRDYWNARRIINGTDRAAEIAGYALEFEAALDAAHRPVPESRSTPTSETRRHWLMRIVLAVWEALKP